MRLWTLTLAARLIRWWARVYTRGVDAPTRRRRCAEIESDVWESLHDPENTGATGIHMLVRFARGIPADVSWRLEHTLTGEELMRKKLVLVCFTAAAAMTMLWFLFPRPESLSLPSLPVKPVPNYVEVHRGPPPPPPPPPTWEEFVAKVNGRPRPADRSIQRK
jgi:hypothetical protein